MSVRMGLLALLAEGPTHEVMESDVVREAYLGTEVGS